MTRLSISLLGLLGASVLGAQSSSTPPALSMAVVNISAVADSSSGHPRPNMRAARVGDQLHYTLTFTNTTARPLHGVTFNDPLPADVHLVDGSVHTSAADVGVTYSVDGGKTFSAHPMTTVRINGVSTQKVAAPETYTGVRWLLNSPIAPHTTVTATFDARVGPSLQH